MRLYDTLTAQKRDFAPLEGEVKMYVCGITPYSPSHVGHAMSYVYFDVLRRWLEARGWKVRHVQNFTDIDDKIIQRAQREGLTTQELADRYIAEYFEDMDALNVQRAHIYPRATESIGLMIEMIQRLIQKGHAYESQGDVYFRVLTAKNYGKLSHRTLEGMMAGARVEPEAGKEHPMDFALWKAAKPGEPWWDSPWGKGRPGWHIECSAMSLRYLGETLDIHGGGQDLIFPHHENEIAQSEAYTGKEPFVRWWVHNGLLRLGLDKMSKSLGNLVTIKEALARFSPDALRMFFLSSHYRSPLTWSEEGVASSERAVERLRAALREGPGPADGPPFDPTPFVQRFTQAMDDDLNTPQALAVLFDLARELNRAREGGASVVHGIETLRQLAGTLGLTLREPVKTDLTARPFIDLLVEVRGELRKTRQYALADRIRSRLLDLGIVLEDTPQGTRWRPVQ
ncbi:MAG: cysteine--tRNA ligase [Dehalococcoidia bacterium]|nr:cysteine--tRNA ligase [Dehalococcoidia bacterium]MDW8119458.1 cysteine--tRNA ligase [Chloroflexota bacterium]